MKTKREVMLGCWGIGGTLARSFGQRRRLEHGPFAGHSIPSVAVDGMANLSFGWHLPPLARQTQDGVDLMPFVLYDRVTVDQQSFECLLGVRPSLKGWRPTPTSVRILEQLAAEGHILFVDYAARLSTPGAAQLVDDMNAMDLSDSNILTPTTESLRLWMQFYKDLFGATDLELQTFHRAIAALRGDEPVEVALGYLYECVSDINRMLVLAQELDQPVYEWEDYCRYYRYKFLRTGKRSPERPRGRTLGELFDVFMPNFAIRSYEELQDIRHDNRLVAVRNLVEVIGDKPVNKDVVLQANTDVLRVKKKLDTFSKYVGYVGYPLSLLPGPVGNVLQDVTNTIAKRWLERNVQWQMFFVERALQYDEKQVEDVLRKQERATK